MARTWVVCPSVISVSGVTGPIGDFLLSLNNLSHDWPDDIGAVIVSPTGRAVLLFSGAGDDTPAGNANLTFIQNSVTEINREGALVGGTHRPGMQQWAENFPAPGPGTNFGFSFQPYLNENPNGDWRLFVQDSGQGERGFIANGWSVNFTTVPEPSAIVLLVTASIAIFGMRCISRRHVG